MPFYSFSMIFKIMHVGQVKVRLHVLPLLSCPYVTTSLMIMQVYLFELIFYPWHLSLISYIQFSLFLSISISVYKVLPLVRDRSWPLAACWNVCFGRTTCKRSDWRLSPPSLPGRRGRSGCGRVSSTPIGPVSIFNSRSPPQCSSACWWILGRSGRTVPRGTLPPIT